MAALLARQDTEIKRLDRQVKKLKDEMVRLENGEMEDVIDEEPEWPADFSDNDKRNARIKGDFFKQNIAKHGAFKDVLFTFFSESDFTDYTTHNLMKRKAVEFNILRWLVQKRNNGQGGIPSHILYDKFVNKRNKKVKDAKKGVSAIGEDRAIHEE